MKVLTLDEVVDNLRILLPLPEAVLRAIELISNSRSSTAMVAKAIESDQALTAKMLQLANSAYYSPRRRIPNVEQAIVRVGYATTKEMLLSAAAWHGLERVRGVRTLPVRDLWRHSLGAAFCARTLAGMVGQVRAEEAYTTALLHDLGLLAVMQAAPAEMARVVEISTKGRPLAQAEREVLGFDHAEVGAKLLEMWQLPESSVATVRWHHEPMAVAHDEPQVFIVHLANTLSHAMGLHTWPMATWEPANREAVEALGLDLAAAEMVIKEAERAMRGAEQYLGLPA